MKYVIKRDRYSTSLGGIVTETLGTHLDGTLGFMYATNAPIKRTSAKSAAYFYEEHHEKIEGLSIGTYIEGPKGGIYRVTTGKVA